MTIPIWSLEWKVKVAIGKNFQIESNKSSPNSIIFKSQCLDKGEFTLFHEMLTEYQIVEIAKILEQVYSSADEQRWMVHARGSNRRLSLNSPTEESSKFVEAVLGLKGSAFHKLLLLTSGAHALKDVDLEFKVTLAKAKKEPFYDLRNVESEASYNHLQTLYILPGISALTTSTNRIYLISDRPEDMKQAVILMAFLANRSDTVTLREHLKLSVAEAVATREALGGFRNLKIIQRLLFTDYKDLAESMIAKELEALSLILDTESELGNYPKAILRSRAAAMSNNRPTNDHSVSDSIYKYLSADEKSSVSALKVVADLDSFLKSGDFRAKTPPVVYAALAELYAVEGEDKALEVARQLTHLKTSRMKTYKLYEATVGLICIPLNPEFDDFPVSDFPLAWLLQLSEYAWVLTSDLPDEKPRATV